MNDTHHTMEHNHIMEGMGEMDHSSVQMGGMDHHAMMVQDFKRRFWVSLTVMIPIMILSPMIQMFLGVDWRFPGDSYVLLVLSTFLFFYGGWPFLKGAKDELKRRSPAMMTLIALAIIVAYVYSAATVFGVQGSDFFWELASLIVIMLLGHWIEMRSVMGASKALEELARLMPENAHMIMDNGETMDMPVSSLKTGQTVLVKPGEKIPIDGVVYEGGSEVNEAMITGEAVPVEKGKGDEVIGGSVNGDGILKFKVSHVGDETFLSQVIRLVRDAQASKSNTQRLADRAAKWLFYIALVTGIITFVSWMAIEGNLNFAVTRAVTVIIICCPHALGLAMPLVTSVSTSLAAKNGLLIRNRAAFENARNLDTVVFDKTGTLTEGSFGVTDIQADCVSQDELLAIAASVEANSEHPIARGIVEAGKGRKLAALRVTDYQNLTGEGLRASVDGRPVKIVSPGYLKREGIAFDEKTYSHLAKEGKTVVFILRGSKLLGFIALSDVVRPTAKEAVDELKQMGVTSIMLTGDNQRAADYAARQLDISKVFAEVLPGDKASKIDALHRDGRRVAMTGDGVNDAPSLAKADLGIAIGAGTSVAIETVDVILVKSNPLDVVSILRLSRATFKKMVQNLIWATAYNVVALPLAAGVLYYQGVVISPAAGAVLMSLSTIIVAINARLLKLPEK